MGNSQHLEWLLEGVDAWNKRRVEEPFTPDLSGFDIRQAFMDKGIVDKDAYLPLNYVNFANAILVDANLSKANLYSSGFSHANLERANLSGSRFQYANLTGASFRYTNLESATFGGHEPSPADLHHCDFQHSLVSGLEVRTYLWGGTPEEGITSYKGGHTDLSRAQNLTQDQLDSMNGDTGTILPENLIRPSHWTDMTDQLGLSPIAPPLDLPEFQTAGEEVTLRNHKIALSPGSLPRRDELETLFIDLKEDVSTFHRSSNLGNLSPAFQTALIRFLNILPEVFAELDQIRFGVQANNMRTRFTSSRSEIEEIAPERVGFIEAILFSSELLAARLPKWAEFLSETDPEVEIVETNVEEVAKALVAASTQISNAPETYDEALAERMREYIDTATIRGYIAAEHILFNTLHATFVALKKHNADVGEKLYELHTKATAKIIYATIGDAAATLAGLQPTQFSWVKHGLDWLARIVAGA